jgi:hypothetical protein
MPQPTRPHHSTPDTPRSLAELVEPRTKAVPGLGMRYLFGASGRLLSIDDPSPPCALLAGQPLSHLPRRISPRPPTPGYSRSAVVAP